MEKTNNILKLYPLSIFSHFPCLANFAGSKTSLAWNGSSEIDGKVFAMLSGLEYELKVMSKINSKNTGVVIHAGFADDRKNGLLTVSKSINKIKFGQGYRLLIENSAGQGTSLGTTLEELKIMYDNILPEIQPFIFFCIDTCHLFAYGDYDISKITEIDRFERNFTDLFGREKLALIHLNDSKKGLKCRVDRHENICKGKIWKPETLRYFLQKFFDIPMVLETNMDDMTFLFNFS